MISGNVSQVHQRETFAFNFLDHDRQNLALLDFVLRKENKTSTVFSLFGYGDTLKQYKLVGYLKHYTRTITCTTVCTLSTSVAHVFKHLQRIVNQVVAFVTVDVNHHADATRIVFVFGIIQSICHILLH